MHPTSFHRFTLTLAALAVAGCAAPATVPPTANAPGGASAASVATWRMVGGQSPDRFRPAAPGAPTAEEAAELVSLQAHRTIGDENAIRYWNDPEPVQRWSEVSRNVILAKGLPQPSTARALALVHAAMLDAVIATRAARQAFGRPGPAAAEGLKPLKAREAASYPSEHAAIALAATEALEALFPEDRASLDKQAETAVQTRLLAGLAYRSDVEAGRKLGRAVAQVLTPRLAEGDGSLRAPLRSGPGLWSDPNPTTPGAASWTRWSHAAAPVIPAPPAIGSPALEASLDELVSIQATLTPAQLQTAKRWDADPAGSWNQVALDLLLKNRAETPVAARALAAMHMAQADAFIVCWDAKYRYLVPRPTMLRPDLKAPLANPATPSYPSHAGIAAASAAVVLGAALPESKDALMNQAAEAAESRLWGGVHTRFDRDAGFDAGVAIGEALAREEGLAR